MDQPQHQIFESGKQSYRYMSHPFQKQPLQLLYPGMVMQQDWHYTGENIPNEDPIGISKTHFQTAALTKAAKMEQEALARHLGGKDKIVAHPAVEPEAVIEDPDLAMVSSSLKLDDLEHYDVPTNVKKSRDNPSKYIVPNTQDDGDYQYNQDGGTTYTYDNDSSDDFSNVTTSKSCNKSSCTITTCDYGSNECTSVTCDNHGNNCDPSQQCDWTANCNGGTKPQGGSGTVGVWISVIVIGILAVIFIILIIYGIHKSKSHALAVQPKTFNIVAPEYFPQNLNPNLTPYGEYRIN